MRGRPRRRGERDGASRSVRHHVQGRFLSPDGRCKSFDAAADGYGRGEGAGMIVLKPVDAAVHDGDRIYAVIEGTGANQDGRTMGITVPNGAAQRDLAFRVCAQAG